MDPLPSIGRRRALGLGLGVAALAVLAPTTLAAASSGRAATDDPTPRGLRVMDAPSGNPVRNGSFEDDVPGPTAPGWTFHTPT